VLQLRRRQVRTAAHTWSAGKQDVLFLQTSRLGREHRVLQVSVAM